jgi:hypothetical protein
MGSNLGKCPDDPSAKPYVFTLSELADVDEGDTKQMPKGCGPNIEGDLGGSRLDYLRQKGWGWPENGEFEYGGGGDACGVCSFDYGCECAGIDAVIGSKGKVKRKAFLADKTECCLANSSARDSVKTIGDKTCAKAYRDPSRTDCTNVFNTYCSHDDRIVNDEKCKKLVNTNASLYNQIMETYCNLNNTNANSNACIDWCGSNNTKCIKLNMLTGCKTFGIPEADCTSTAVKEFRDKCKIPYGILSGLDAMVGSYPCTVEGVKALEADCQLYNLDQCNVTAVDNAKIAKAASDSAEAALEQSRQQFEYTQNALQQVLNMPSAEGAGGDEDEMIPSRRPSKKPKPSEDNTLMYIIPIFIIICIISMSSSSMIGLFALNKGKIRK